MTIPKSTIPPAMMSAEKMCSSKSGSVPSTNANRATSQTQIRAMGTTTPIHFSRSRSRIGLGSRMTRRC